MNKLKDYFIAKLLSDISDDMRYIYCHHRLVKHGVGYKCLGCNYYSGTQEFNKIIRGEKNEK